MVRARCCHAPVLALLSSAPVSSDSSNGGGAIVIVVLSTIASCRTHERDRLHENRLQLLAHLGIRDSTVRDLAFEEDSIERANAGDVGDAAHLESKAHLLAAFSAMSPSRRRRKRLIV